MQKEKALLNKTCDNPPCTGQSCMWLGCAKLADRIYQEMLAERRKKWRESKRKQLQKIMCKSGD